MLLLPVLTKANLIHLTVPAFYPLGAIVGGYLFGLSMTWAGGCAAGVWYKAGEGDLSSLIAALGMAIGAAGMEEGPFRPFRETFQQTLTPESLRSVTLPHLLSLQDDRPLALLLALPLFLYLLRKRSIAPSGSSWGWKRTGILMGGLGLLSWLLARFSGAPYGMAVIPGAVDLVEYTAKGESYRLSWFLFILLGIPVGGYLAARRAGPVSLEMSDGKSLLRSFAGGIMLGFTASLAAGCTVGHSLIGLPLLSIGSLVTTVFIILGSWTAGYIEMRQAPHKNT
jgi:uncharacterized membrane protein YedE/YeeE